MVLLFISLPAIAFSNHHLSNPSQVIKTSIILTQDAAESGLEGKERSDFNKPLWLKSWFIVIVISLIVGGLSVYFSFRERNLKRRTRSLQQELEKTKLESGDEYDEDDENPDPSHEFTASILVAIHDTELKRTLENTLDGQYYLIDCRNDKEGMTKALEELPDLVITDIRLPEMDGVSLCRQLNDHPATNHIPVILLADEMYEPNVASCIDNKADDILVKPFEAGLLMEKVENFVHQRRTLQKVFRKEYFSVDALEEPASPHFSMLKEIIEKFEEHIADPDFKLDALCEEMNISRSQLFRKVRSVANTTPNELLRMIRIKRAARLLRKNNMNVTQVMSQIGYRTPSHFANSFKQYYGMNPAEYRNHKS